MKYEINKLFINTIKRGSFTALGLFILTLLNLIQIINCSKLDCVNFDESCLNRTCCEPYVCYKPNNMCVGMNITK